MKKNEWYLAMAFIVIGLLCLTMAAVFSLGHYSTPVFFGILLQICLWFFIPLITLFIVYFVIKVFNKK